VTSIFIDSRVPPRITTFLPEYVGFTSLRAVIFTAKTVKNSIHLEISVIDLTQKPGKSEGFK
jgi:hypothetical protein